ncbi:MAG: hypothetical protein F6J96_24240 [Symploca sp. SIO1C2]|nr:hypothetical protein [Symploca sp. SIO1C2]
MRLTLGLSLITFCKLQQPRNLVGWVEPPVFIAALPSIRIGETQHPNLPSLYQYLDNAPNQNHILVYAVKHD